MLQTLNYEKIASQIAEIPKIAKEHKWKVFYDSEMDEFYFSPEKIEKKYLLCGITDEIMMYVDEDSNIGGIFIEYFTSNLVSHNDKFKPFKKLFKKSRTGLNKEELVKLTNTIEASLTEFLLPKLVTH